MDIIYVISLVIIGVASTLLRLEGSKWYNLWGRVNKTQCFVVIVICLLFQAYYGFKQKREEHDKSSRTASYQNETLRKQHKLSEDLKELKEKDKKELLTEADYGRYIALSLDDINLSLKRLELKNIREWVIAYYEEVDKIPNYFSPQEWRDSEKFIYDSMIESINSGFSIRNIFDHPLRTEALKTFKKERDRLLQAKQREFDKTNEPPK